MSTISTIPDTFTPQAGKSNYTKLTPGKHRLRILGNAISGWEWWLDTPEGGRQPQRIKENQNPPVEYAETVKKFLAFPVWNYEQEKLQILEVSQTSIQRELKALDKDADWGDLTTYDIEIERMGNDKNSTKYFVRSKPKAELSKEVKKATAVLPVLEALYENADPFTYTTQEHVDQAELDRVFAE